jgi:hypothetical protein
MNSRTFPENRASEVAPQSTADILLIRGAVLVNLKSPQGSRKNLEQISKLRAGDPRAAKPGGLLQRVRDD